MLCCADKLARTLKASILAPSVTEGASALSRSRGSLRRCRSRVIDCAVEKTGNNLNKTDCQMVANVEVEKTLPGTPAKEQHLLPPYRGQQLLSENMLAVAATS
jgi:hypothetical protein